MPVRRVVGKAWGLRPAMTRCIYTGIIQPMMCYAAMVWWIKTDQRGPKLL